MTALVASLLAGVAVATFVGSPHSVLRRRLGAERTRAWLRPRRPVAVIAAVVVSVALVVRLGDRPHVIVTALSGCAIAYAAVALRRRGARRTRRHQRQAETVDICDAFVSELASGSPPPRMLAHVAIDWPFLEPAARTADLGGDVAQGLRSLATEPGRAALADIAAAWELSVRSGAGLAGVLDRLSRALRADDEARQEVIASLAAPRATSRVLALLPAFGLALGSGLGGDPVGVLFGTMLGALCLAVGSGLAIGGLFWVEHIADAAEVG
ncbi:MAG: type II secretion system F family protein [Actinomycetia bacterium]|nr:type II secretion system F family protein [Actinomycetes bacterium]